MARSHGKKSQPARQQPQSQGCQGNPERGQEPSPTRPPRAHQGQHHHHKAGPDPEQRSPALIGWVTPHGIERQVLTHDGPLGPMHQPVQHAPTAPSEQDQEQQRDQTIRPARHQRLLRRRPSTATFRTDMPPLINRLSSRKLNSSNKNPSMARPVCVMVVSLTAYRSA